MNLMGVTVGMVILIFVVIVVGMSRKRYKVHFSECLVRVRRGIGTGDTTQFKGILAGDLLFVRAKGIVADGNVVAWAMSTKSTPWTYELTRDKKRRLPEYLCVLGEPFPRDVKWDDSKIDEVQADLSQARTGTKSLTFMGHEFTVHTTSFVIDTQDKFSNYDFALAVGRGVWRKFVFPPDIRKAAFLFGLFYGFIIMFVLLPLLAEYAQYLMSVVGLVIIVLSALGVAAFMWMWKW